jgi:hypothetical protein
MNAALPVKLSQETNLSHEVKKKRSIRNAVKIAPPVKLYARAVSGRAGKAGEGCAGHACRSAEPGESGFACTVTVARADGDDAG